MNELLKGGESVEVVFRSKKLETYYKNSKKGCKVWGDAVARRYIQRIDLLQEAENMLEVHKLPGLRCHPLKGKREGQYAINLVERWRLIFILAGEKAEIICIEEVSKHYGE